MGKAADIDALVQRVSWDAFMSNMDWRQGEHVTLIGPTGCGKTTVTMALLPLRNYVCFVATKPRDPLIKSLPRKGYTRVETWPPPDYVSRAVLWPPITTMGHKDRQRTAIRNAMHLQYRSGGWCVVADELRYISQTLGLKAECEMFWLQGRSLGLSFVTATQRPSWVPLEAYDQASHLFIWRETDRRNLDRLGDIGGVDTALVKRLVPKLPRHDFLYVNTRDGSMRISNAKQ